MMMFAWENLRQVQPPPPTDTHPPSRRRDYHFADTPSLSLLKRLLNGEVGLAE